MQEMAHLQGKAHLQGNAPSENGDEIRSRYGQMNNEQGAQIRVWQNEGRIGE